MSFKTVILLLAAAAAVAVETQKRVVCYYGSWAVYRPGSGKFDVENIDPYLCTHLVYGFLGLGGDNKIRFLDAWNDLPDNYGKNAIGRMANLRKVNPNLNVLLAIGGWNEGSTKYSQMAASSTARATFVQSVVETLNNTGYDGFDFDWEYPTQRGGSYADKENFRILLSELKKAFGGKYTLSAAVSAGCNVVEQSYDVLGIAKELDFINLMTYDMHGAWEQTTGHHTQLFPSDLDPQGTKCFNVYDALTLWMNKGASPEKINLGLATYGRGWVLNDPAVNGLNAPGSRPLPAGPYTRETGFWGYNEICERLRSEKWEVVRDGIVGGPYAHKDNLWIGYEDPESIKQKAEFAMAWKLGGVMTWSIETDDFRGDCGGESFPLIRTMRRVVLGNAVTPIFSTSTTRPSYGSSSTASYAITTRNPWSSRPTTSRSTSSWTSPSAGRTCTTEGFFRNPNDCKTFYRCVDHGEDGFRQYEYTCPARTVFNEAMQSCDWPENVPGCL